MNGVRVAVLAGGLSLERDVSLRSGARVADALRDAGHAPVRVDLDDRLVPTLVDGGFAAAYVALHGRAGEDGTIQNLLDLLEIPYTGPGPLASALTWNKSVAKGLYRRAGLETPRWVAVSSAAVRDMGVARALPQVVERLGLPLVVKPAESGAALGLRRVATAEDLAPALLGAFSYSDVALVEQEVVGQEVSVAIVDGEALPPVEIVPKAGVYDFAARYTHGATDFFAPARLAPDILERCRESALTAYHVAGCRHVSRADFIVDRDGVPWILELDTCPGMTETSLVPMAAAAGGASFLALVCRILGLALRDGPRSDTAAPHATAG